MPGGCAGGLNFRMTGAKAPIAQQMSTEKRCRDQTAAKKGDEHMANKMKKVDIRKLPFPIRPGDPVFFVLEDEPTIEEDVIESVGIDEEGRLFVICDSREYEVGNLDRVFMTHEDAERYVANPQSIPDDYGIIEYSDLDLPYYPGTVFYYCDYDGMMARWDIFEEYYTQVFFDILGNVDVGDGESECRVIGQNLDPCFETLREARAFVRSQR